MPLKHGEAGATPVDAPNEDVAQIDRVLVSETSGHRYRFAEASYDPVILARGNGLASLAPKSTNGRLQDWGSIPHVSTKSPGRQVGRLWSAKPTIRGFDSHPGVQALQCHLMAKVLGS